MLTDADGLAANVDYGNAVGFFVRIDIDLPQDSLYTKDGHSDHVSGCLCLTPVQAEEFAAKLLDMAQRTRAARNESQWHNASNGVA